MSDGIGGFIDDILNAIGNGADIVARKAWAAITSVWNVSTDFWWRIFVEHSAGADIIHRLRNYAQAFVSHTFTLFKWILTVFIPRFVQNAINTVTSWVNRLISDVRNAISSVYHTLLKWATDQFNSLIKWLGGLEKWATNEISKLWHDLTYTIKMVTHFLTDPSVLVEWFWDAAWAKARQWVQQNETALARWLWQHAISGTMRMAAILEDLIVRIL